MRILAGELKGRRLLTPRGATTRPTADQVRLALMDTLTPDAIAAAAVFDAGAIDTLIRDHMERRVNVGYHLWGLVTLFLWMKRWRVEALPEEALRERARTFATR